MTDDVWIGFAMLGYGKVMAWGEVVRASERGEYDFPADHWLDLYERAHPDDRAEILELAREELERWRRRPEPPDEAETFDELKTRIVKTGEGWTPKEVALAMRCTPTLVRAARMEADRHPETGKIEGSIERARELLSTGHSLRQVAILTGIPKSTLHDALRSAA
jgi:hypothetical protein